MSLEQDWHRGDTRARRQIVERYGDEAMAFTLLLTPGSEPPRQQQLGPIVAAAIAPPGRSHSAATTVDRFALRPLHGVSVQLGESLTTTRSSC